MKLTISLALCMTLLLLGDNGNAKRLKDEYDDDYYFDDEPLDEEIDDLTEQPQDDYEYVDSSKPNRRAWHGFLRALKIALRTLKGVNCTIKEVIKVRDACLEFLESTKTCSIEMTRQVRAIIDSVNAVLRTCNEIIHVNSQICGNGEPSENDNDVRSTRTSSICFARLLRKICILRRQIRRTQRLIRALPGDTANCFIDACTDLGSTFSAFPSNIKTCSKLTSSRM